MLIPFTLRGNPQDHRPIECACGKLTQMSDVDFVWTSKGDEEPGYHAICEPCIVARVTQGNC